MCVFVVAVVGPYDETPFIWIIISSKEISIFPLDDDDDDDISSHLATLIAAVDADALPFYPSSLSFVFFSRNSHHSSSSVVTLAFFWFFGFWFLFSSFSGGNIRPSSSVLNMPRRRHRRSIRNGYYPS